MSIQSTLSRRDFLQRLTAIGMTVPIATSLLAGCPSAPFRTEGESVNGCSAPTMHTSASDTIALMIAGDPIEQSAATSEIGIESGCKHDMAIPGPPFGG